MMRSAGDAVIPLTRPFTGPEELEEIAAVLETGQLSQGPKVEEFEALVAAHVGVRHAFATSSCTTALHLALVALGIGPGDEVIVPDFTFVATANVVVQQGAIPVFVDIQPDTYNVDPDELAGRVTSRTRAVMPVDLFGLCADIDPVLKFADEYGLSVIEDAACGLGSTYYGRPCGSDADVSCYSFHARKVVTTGEGGMVVTNSDEWAEILQLARNHGGLRANNRFTFERAGFNYRLSDLHAAMGVVQMRRLADHVARRRQLADDLRSRLDGIPGLQLPAEPPWGGHVYQSFVVMLDETIDRDAVITALRDDGIESTLGSYAMHDQPFFQRSLGLQAGQFPNSHRAFEQSLALPFFPAMTPTDVEVIGSALGRALTAVT